MYFTSLLKNEQDNRVKTEKSARTAALICLVGSSLMFLFQLLLSFLYSLALSYFPSFFTDTVSYIVDILMYVIYIIGPFGIAALIFKKFNKNIENNIVKRSSPRSPALYIFGSIGIGYLVNFTINILFSQFIEQFSVDMELSADGPLEIVFCFVLYAVLPAIFEEWAFRGVLLKNLLPYGKGGAIIISSLLFGIAHVDPPRIVFATAFGLMLAVCYEHTRSLKIPMLIHFINNAISVTITLFPEESTMTIILSQLVLGFMGCGIAAIIYYANKGIARQKITLRKPECIGYKLSIGQYMSKFALNFGMIPLAVMYIIFFALYYLVQNG